MHVRTPYEAPDDQDWRLTEYVFPGKGISDECVDADCGVETTFTYGCGGCDIGRAPMRFMFESFSQTAACDSTWVDDITITSLAEEEPVPFVTDGAAHFMTTLDSNDAHISVFGSEMQHLLPSQDLTVEMWTKCESRTDPVALPVAERVR